MELKNLFKKIYKKIIYSIFLMLYGKIKYLEKKLEEIRVTKINYIDNINLKKINYKIFEIKEARIFTNYVECLGIIKKNFLIKDISFQSSINNFLSKDDIKWLNLEGDFASGFSETRNGKSLWKTFLLIGIILLLIESIVGRPNPSKMKIEKVDA